MPFPFVRSCIVLLVLILLSSIRLQAGEPTCDASDKKCPHVIFFVHGLMGGNTTFGDLQEVLRQEYDIKKEDGKNLIFKSLDYDTAPSSKNAKVVHLTHPYDFARIMSTRMINFMYERGYQQVREFCKGEGYDIPEWKYENRSVDTDYLHAQKLKMCLAHAKDKSKLKYIINQDTEYSLIVHSQGGIIAMSFLNSCLYADDVTHYYERCDFTEGVSQLNKLRDRDGVGTPFYISLQDRLKDIAYHQAKHKAALKRPPQNIRNLITLASPLGGTATGMISFTHEMVAKKLNILNLMPAAQVEQLAFGSPTYTWQKMLMLNRFGSDREFPYAQWAQQKEWQNPYPKSLNVVNVAGNISSFLDGSWNPIKKALKMGLNPEIFELDLIVGTPEARVDFLYHIENMLPGHAPLVGKTHLASAYHPLKTAHVPLPFKGITGVANVTLDDYNTHPSWGVIKGVFDQSFRGIPADSDNFASLKKSHYVDKLSNFMMEIKLITPKGYHRPFRVDSAVTIKAADNSIYYKKSPVLGSTLMVPTYGYNEQAVKMKDNFFQTYYHMGRFNRDNSFYPKTDNADDLYQSTDGGHNITYTFNVPGFDTKTVTHAVLPSFDSFVEVFLKPYFPIPYENRDGSVIAVVKNDDTHSTVFRMQDNQLELESVNWRFNLPTEVSNNRCHVAIAGRTTPVKFRHNHHWVTPKKNRRSKKKDTQRSEDWFKYALNQQKLFKTFDEAMAQTPEEKKGQKQMRPGMLLEVIGRFAVGKKDDQFNFGRDNMKVDKRSFAECQITAQMQTKNISNECQEILDKKESFDRYLITSPFIRKLDKVEKFRDLGKDGLKGLRWVNVVDVDMLKMYPNRKGNNVPGSSCVLDDLRRHYSRDYGKLFYPTKTMKPYIVKKKN